MSDWIRESVIELTTKKNLSSYEVARLVNQAGGSITEGHVRAYLRRKKSMTSAKLCHVLRAIGVSGLATTKKKSAK